MYLLDTDTIIYSQKGHRQVMDNFARHAAAPKAMSVITTTNTRHFNSIPALKTENGAV
ncbi:MAG: hypothetical protein WCH61_01160 [bacterium]